MCKQTAFSCSALARRKWHGKLLIAEKKSRTGRLKQKTESKAAKPDCPSLLFGLYIKHSELSGEFSDVILPVYYVAAKTQFRLAQTCMWEYFAYSYM